MDVVAPVAVADAAAAASDVSTQHTVVHSQFGHVCNTCFLRFDDDQVAAAAVASVAVPVAAAAASLANSRPARRSA